MLIVLLLFLLGLFPSSGVAGIVMNFFHFVLSSMSSSFNPHTFHIPFIRVFPPGFVSSSPSLCLVTSASYLVRAVKNSLRFFVLMGCAYVCGKKDETRFDGTRSLTCISNALSLKEVNCNTQEQQVRKEHNIKT